MDLNDLLDELKEYAVECWHKVSTGYRHYAFSFGSYGYKIQLSNSKMKDLLKDYREKRLDAKVVMFYFGVLDLLPFGRKFNETAVIKLTEKKMSGYCNRNTYKKYRDVLVDYGLLVPTVRKGYFIVNPKHAHKFFKTRIEKTEEEFKADLEKRKK